MRLTALLLVALLTACERAPNPPNAEDRPPAPSQPAIPQARDADDAARYLAGLPGRTGSPYLALENTEAWKAHRGKLDAAWAKAEVDLVGRLRAFAQQELTGSRWAAPVFYPFGGPDALTVTQLFPRSPSFTLVGLEPAGALPSFHQFEQLDQAGYLAETRDTVASVLGKSFFITHVMDRQFRGQITDGLLLPILQLLVRTGHRVLGFREVHKGIEMEFESGDSTVHRLTYLSVNLSDTRLAENQPFLAYLQGLKGVTTFFKATSYMPHRPEFSKIREAVLAGSQNVLQDDSGIPYAQFSRDTWDVQLYGAYTRPYGSFKWMEQLDLREAYAQPGVKPLALRLGYGYGRVASNLLMATRR